ncbi:MAG: hypothetical protein RML33_10090 [Acidobacteriota bacterium]|nr:hypothetical protein [Pyrinomonadaceae bacterium]MDW8305168.1 hypothetical protein [Acidobacteriota bacterium]
MTVRTRVYRVPIVSESEWRFDTSAGVDISIGLSSFLFLAGTIGGLWVKRDSDRDPVRLTYGGLGGGLGLSLVPSPVNISFSLPQMPSEGRIYKTIHARETLDLNEIRGPFLLIQGSADAGPGYSGSLMFLGGSKPDPLLLLQRSNIVGFILTCYGCVRFGGMTATLLPFNLNLSVYGGLLL